MVKFSSSGGVIIKQILQYVQNMPKSHLMISISVLAMFLPFYLCLGIWIVQCIYLLYTREMVVAYQQSLHTKYILLFSLLSMVVSLYYQNYIGFGCSIVVLCVLSMIVYYMKHITKELFEKLVDLILFLSIFCAIYGLFEYMGILSSMGINGFEVIVLDGPNQRLNSIFFNANYYATMIEFFVMMCVYKLLKCKSFKRCIWYIGILAINFVLLYLTGCRTAWPAIGIGLLIMLMCDNQFKMFKLVLVIGIIVLIVFCIYPEIFPRTDSIAGYLDVRKKIWLVSLQSFKDHFLFGEGPLTYMHVYLQYGGVYTQHSHSIYLDPLVSYGVVGITVISPYVISNIKQLVCVYRSKVDISLLSLIIGTICVILIHGILDYTVYFIQTGYLFLLIIGAYAIYLNQGGKKYECNA